MHKGFKEWLINDSRAWSPSEKGNFLRMMKFEPDKVKHIIADNLIDWATIFSMDTGTMLATSTDGSHELFEEYKKHFSTEIAAVT